ncbi:RHS repeat-associated core domain-containing protein [Aestuariibacter sp. AA17]|uniref:RHS repeat-associated core domain-containing protein n=1 Tax=Fluctibacter corallii TaxID=2984329 RepID=A0ABT3ADW6_9ALTE|nr:RHS repeat-associated core domain-containing protein [Aestuariibacter sp. AA17]MCV2886507.1 RHS repeat-associated core domain-containing protein [Aestuariibacter sp. AA17]
MLYQDTPAGGVNNIYLGSKLIAKDGFIPNPGGTQNHRPYGSSIEGEADDIGYTGHKFDTDLGLSYMQARYYDPVIGRFYSNDPVDALGHLASGNVQGFNRYAYANNNPYKYVDPDGNESRSAIVNEAITKDYLKGKATKKDVTANAIAIGGGKAGKFVIENLTPMGLYMDVAENLDNGDVPINEALGEGSEKGAGKAGDVMQDDLKAGGSIRATIVKEVVVKLIGEGVKQGSEKIDELANKEIDQKLEEK